MFSGFAKQAAVQTYFLKEIPASPSRSVGKILGTSFIIKVGDTLHIPPAFLTAQLRTPWNRKSTV
jgi:hypothetical protein